MRPKGLQRRNARARLHQSLIRINPVWTLGLFTAVYLAIGGACAGLYWFLHHLGAGGVSNPSNAPATQTAGDYLYFSYITQLTIGYGDLVPTGAARGVAVFQGLVGPGLFAVWIAYMVLRLTSPDPRTLVFSQKAVYIRSEKCFGVLVINTTGLMVTNVELRSVVKFHRRHQAAATYDLPYLRDSALLVKTGSFDVDVAAAAATYDRIEDGLKVSLQCSLLGGAFVTGMKYDFTEVLVTDTDAFMDRSEFQSPNLASPDFWSLFNDPVTAGGTVDNLFAPAAPVTG